MPTLREVLARQNNAQRPSTESSLEPRYNQFIRCPIPPLTTSSSDNLRQYYMGGMIPQSRMLNPPALTFSTGGGSTTNNTTIVNNSGGSSTSTSFVAKSVSLTTPVLSPQTAFQSSIQMAKGFLLLTATANNAARIELYGNSTAQANDLSRPIDVAPGAGVFQNIISDVVLDTAPFTYAYQNRAGSNNTSPQNSTVYITITNESVGSAAITATIVFVPLQS